MWRVREDGFRVGEGVCQKWRNFGNGGQGVDEMVARDLESLRA